MYACSRRILALMALCFLLEIISLFVILGLGFRGLKGQSSRYVTTTLTPLSVVASSAPSVNLCTPIDLRLAQFVLFHLN